jgi:DNA-binding MarR family transcriptional regulator
VAQVPVLSNKDPRVGEDALEAVLTASRTLIAVATQSLGAAAEDTTIAQYRALVVLASRGPQRLVDLAGALVVAPSTAGRMCDRLARKGLIRRHRGRADRRSVTVSVTDAGRAVVDEATARRRGVIASILGRLTEAEQREIAAAMRVFADAGGEIPDSRWPTAAPYELESQPARSLGAEHRLKVAAPGQRTARPARQVR